MKKAIIFIILFFTLFSCHKVKIGYLDGENAVYIPDSTVIRAIPDPVYDEFRIRTNADWVTTKIQGVIGTAPIKYKITDIKSKDKKSAEIMRKICKINGSGVISLPLNHNVPIGHYLFSIKISNIDYHINKTDIITIIIK